MVLRVLLKGGQGRLFDSSEEESRSRRFSQSSTEDYYGGSGTPPPRPPMIAKALKTQPVTEELEYDFANRRDYSLCKGGHKGGEVDHLKWPSEQRQHAARRGQNSPLRRPILHLVDGQHHPLPRKKPSDPQDIYQRRVPIEDLPIYNSENTAKWRGAPGGAPVATLYPDVHEESTWISYKGRKTRRGVHDNSHRKLRNYY